MAEKNISMNLGIPIFAKGGVHLKEGTEKDALEMSVGSIPLKFVVLRKSNRVD